jgi:prevent-host-death family protein
MTSEEIGAFEAKTHFSRLLQKVQAGKHFYITKHGKRVAELRPAPRASGGRIGGTLKGKIWMAPDFDEPLEDFKDYMP